MSNVIDPADIASLEDRIGQELGATWKSR